MAAVYRSLRALDPYHVTLGATGEYDLWCFGDGSGALSIDAPLVENYGVSVEAHAANDQSLRRWPNDFAVLVNCLWMSNAWWMGPYGLRQLNSATFAGVTAGLYHNLYFALEGMTEDEMVTGVSATLTELAELAPALLSSTVSDPPNPTVSVSAVADIAELAAASQWPPAQHGSGGVVARAWSEPPANGAAEPYCITVVSVNTNDAPTLVNLSLSGLAYFGMPADVNATTPFERITRRGVRLHGEGDTRYMMDVLGPSAKAVYRLGCHAQPFPWGCGDGKAMSSGGWECGLLNADVKW